MAEMIMWTKIAGAVVGSSIAVVFKPGGDRWMKLLQRFVIGTIVGFISAPIILDIIGWQRTLDHWLASATLGGLFGYLALQIFFSAEIVENIKKRIKTTK